MKKPKFIPMKKLSYVGNQEVIYVLAVTLKNEEQVFYLVGYEDEYEVEQAFLHHNFVYATHLSYVEAYPGDWGTYRTEEGYEKLMDFNPTHINVNQFKEISEIGSKQTAAIYDRYL